MIVRDVTLPSAEENILFDDVLLHRAEIGQSDQVLRFWESPKTFVVLGRMSKEEDDLKIDSILNDRIPVVRRSSGGGTVLQGRGCLNYSLILSKNNSAEIADLRKSYSFILGKVVAALNSLGINADFFPISDIALRENQKKFSGNAQKRGRNFILHHGTVLYQFDLFLIEKYLKFPKDVPAYRQGRAHLDFVTNLSLNVSAFKEKMKESFGAEKKENGISPQEQNYLKDFLKLKKLRVDLKEHLLLES